MNAPHIVWPFQTDTVENWAYWDNAFSKEECESIIAFGKQKSLKPALVAGNTQYTPATRDSSTSWILPDEEHRWIFERLTGVVMALNNEYFKFDLFGLFEALQFTEYNAPSGFYTAHIDATRGSLPRKLSVSIQLSAAEDYKGGELLLHYSSKPMVAPTAQGKAIVFPSYMLHEVRPVTEGTRYSLVCWVTGKPFR